MNSVRYFQLLVLLNLIISPNCMVPSSGVRWRYSELALSRSKTFTMVMYGDSYIFTVKLSGLVGLLVTLVGWDSPSLGVWVNLLQYSSGIGIIDITIGFFLVFEIVSPLGDLIYYYAGPPVELRLILYIPTGSKVRYPDLVVSPSKSRLVMPSVGSCVNFLRPISGTFHASPSRATVDVSLYGGVLLSIGGVGTFWSNTRPKSIRNYKVKYRAWWYWEFLLCPPFH